MFIAPHYDDLALTIGGGVLSGHIKPPVYDVVVFSRSNYTNGGGDANYDVSQERIQFVSGKRMIEESNCLKYLGIGLMVLLGEDEFLVRGYKLIPGAEFGRPEAPLDWTGDPEKEI